MNKLLQELHDRSIWQVLGIYLAGGWFAYQVALDLTQGLGLPDWVPPFAMALVAIGLPIVLVTAYVQRRGPRRADFAPAEEQDADEPARPRTLRQRLFTWPRALLGGAAAFVLLGIGTTGFMTMRAMGIGPAGTLIASGRLENRERVVLADFQSTNGDTALAATVTEAFRIDLSRSRAVRILPIGDVRDALTRMNRNDTRLPPELARELAIREGIKAVVEGEIGSVGSGAYILSAKLIESESGEVLTAQRQTASNAKELLAAIDKLTRSMRERVGEPLKEIRSAQPLAQVITPSLPALQKFTESTRASQYEGNTARAVALLREAVALDTEFASAYRALAIQAGNAGQADSAMYYIERTLRFPARLTERERLFTEAMQQTGQREFAAAIATYELILAQNPQDRAILNNIGFVYGLMDDNARSAEYFRRAAEIDTTSYFNVANLGEALVRDKKFPEARAAFAKAAARAPRSSWPSVFAAAVPAAYEDFATAERDLRALRDSSAARPVVVTRASRMLSNVVLARGRVAEARAILVRSAGKSGDPSDAASALHDFDFGVAHWIRHDDRQAKTLLDRRADELQDRTRGDVDLLMTASRFARISDSQRARVFLDRYTSAENRAKPWVDPAVRFVEATFQPDLPRKVELLRASRDRFCFGCEEIDIAEAFERAGQGDSAIAAYQRYLNQPSIDRVWADRFSLANVYERLAQLYDKRGDREAARRNYLKFVNLWESADPELQPRVRAARRALERLTAER